MATKTITIKDRSQDLYGIITEDGAFKCTHPNAEVEPPCCSGRDSEGNTSCGCYGQYSVYCNDCSNDDMTDQDVDDLLTQGEPDYEY